ncbi:MAG: M48 family metalloprotease [Cyanosarcina radialis HA8281-LM2]|jgi:Zn-dependent protease with chaperone function|nr:M48 family metalloprotease [Cyanosarcina radialis HA8281-LM2]
MKIACNSLVLTLSLLSTSTTVALAAERYSFSPNRSEEIAQIDRPKTPTSQPPRSTPKPAPTSAPKPTPADSPAAIPAQTSEPAPEELARQQKLIEADRLYLGGQFAAAEKLYREAKPPFPNTKSTVDRLRQPVYDVAQLPIPGRVYWRIAQQGLAQKLETKTLIPLKMLVEKYPEFIPGSLQYIQSLKDYKRQPEAIEVLERVTTIVPGEAELAKVRIATLRESEKWLDASLAARQFALINPNHPEAAEFTKIADQNMERYQLHLRAKMRENTAANLLTGVFNYAVTGNFLGLLTGIDSTALLLQGESAVGEKVSERLLTRLQLVEDEQVLNYVREIGNKLAAVAGRKDFKYEFYVVKDENLNAFALPGGKVYINAGAILYTNSEAELAGLLAHELAHAVLSHGFQLATQGNLTSNLAQFIPYGGTVADLIVLKYSRDMERQADILGTRLLATTGYAADGMWNLTVTLEKQERERPGFVWLSSHPVTDERVEYIQNLIERNGYNRYAYEGVERHQQIKARLKQLLEQEKLRQERQEQEERQK